jgi:hypothetical protein
MRPSERRSPRANVIFRYTVMSRSKQILLGVSLSLTFDGLLWWVIQRHARIKDVGPSILWWVLTILLAVAALVPLFELARRGRWLERVLAGLLSWVPVGWIGLCTYAAFH